MTARFFFICSALLLFANGAYGDGAYQRTKDGRALVWNNYPTPGDEATWSGKRDTDGYATGYGTLTWHTTKQAMVTGSNLPAAKRIAVSRFSGKMVQGKFDGLAASVDANGKTFHGTFVNGSKANDWVAGPAPRLDKRRDERVTRAEPVEAPAEGPSPIAKTENVEPSEPARQLTSNSESVREQPAQLRKPSRAGSSAEEPPAEGPADQSVKQRVSARADTETPSSDVDDSLRSLISPPSLLKMSAVAAASPQASTPSIASSSPARARLITAEVIELADAEARTKGYDLGAYQRPQAHYNPADDTWSVSYSQKSVDGMSETGKQFSVSVEDKSKNTALKR